MIAFETVDFPADRTLTSSDLETVTIETLSVAIPSETRDVLIRSLCLAVITVFARLCDEPSLQVRLRMDGGDIFVVGSTEAAMPLAEALAAIRTSPAPAAAGMVAVVLDGRGQDAARNDRSGEFGTSRLWFDEIPEGLRLVLEFNPGRLAAVTARDFLEKISVVLTALENDPGIACGAIELIGAEARSFLPDLSRMIETQGYRSAAEQFFDSAARHGAHVAVTNGPHSYSYDDLSAAVRVLAGELRKAGLRPGDVVAVAGLSSFGMISAMLAVLAAGGVLVTVDQSLPPVRQTLIREVSKPRLVIDVGPATDGTVAEGVRVIDWPGSDTVARMRDAAPPIGDVLSIPERNAPAYIFFTSGSTGAPKGVLGAQLGLAHFLTWQRTSFPIGPGDRASQLTALSFDVVLRDVLFPLTSGACLHIPSREQVLDARRMLGWIEANSITVMHSVPSLMKAWLQAHVRGKPFENLRYIFFAGEPLTDSLLTQLQGLASEATVFVNLYGPTETTLAKLSHRIDRIEPGVQPVGMPQPGTEVAILRDRSIRCGLWEVGEIAIRTPYRSLGYFENAALTDSVFVQNPWANDPEDRLYMTGDLGRVRSDGRIEIFGRSDSQIKIRGVRIEPIEIEGLLLRQDGVRDAAITTRPTANGGKVLLALIVAEEPLPETEQSAVAQRLREALSSELHPAMVPSRIVFTETLPYLPNGKCDRKAIAAMDLEMPDATRESERALAGLSERQRALVAGLASILNAPIDDLDRSFVDLGGDSLSYVQATMLVEDYLGHLPDHWEQKPLSALLSTESEGQGAAGFWARIDITMVLRTIGIFFVCLSHTPTGTSVVATSTLFVVSGMNFARFLRPPIVRSGDVSGTVSLILKILIPAAIWQAMRQVASGQFWLPDLILMGTFFQDPENPKFTLWFLDVLAANLIILCLISLAVHALRPARLRLNTPTASLPADILMLGIGVVVAILEVQTGIGDGIVGLESVAPFKWFWMLALGVVITSAVSRLQKAFVTGLLGLLVVAVFSGLPLMQRVFFNVDAFFLVSTALLIWVARFPVPRRLQRLVVVIASSTLFIYIVNNTVILHILPRLHVPNLWPLQVAAAIAVGIVGKFVWDWTSWAVLRRVLPALRKGVAGRIGHRIDPEGRKD